MMLKWSSSSLPLLRKSAKVPKQQIVLYGDNVLRKASKPVEKITPELREFVAEMFKTLKRAKGLGLSAPQVGRNERFFILDLSASSLDHDQMVLINPEIVSVSGEQCGEEGCLSFPGLYLEVTRPNKVVCHYTDLEGQEMTVTAEGLIARAISHENDHLDGKLFIDHISAADRELIAGRLKKIKVS
jgi:peptide deformylase